MRSTHLWLILKAESRLVNSSAKWQAQSDNVFFALGLRIYQKVPQLFLRHENGKFLLIVAKIVDETKAAGEGDNFKLFIERFNKNFELCAISSAPGRMRFFHIDTVQEHDMHVSTDAEHN